MSIQANLYDYGIPIGSIISIIIMLFLFKSLIQSFRSAKKKKARITKLRVTTVIVFISYVLYCVQLILGRWVFDVTACSIRIPSVAVGYTITRAAIYFFFLTRGEVSFAGSAMAFKPLFIKLFGVFIVVTYLIYAVCHVATAHHIEWDRVNRICVPTEPEGARVIYGFTYPFLAIDFLIGVAICGLFARKLWVLQHQIDSTVDDTDDTVRNTVDFIKVAKKQTKLAFVACMTSLISLYIMPATKFLGLPFLDALANVICVYATFAVPGPNKVYRYLCECDGNKCCLCFFCFCCWCCNVAPLKAARMDGSKPDLEKVASNETEENKPSSAHVETVDVVTTRTVDATATSTTEITDTVS